MAAALRRAPAPAPAGATRHRRVSPALAWRHRHVDGARHLPRAPEADVEDVPCDSGW